MRYSLFQTTVQLKQVPSCSINAFQDIFALQAVILYSEWIEIDIAPGFSIGIKAPFADSNIGIFSFGFFQQGTEPVNADIVYRCQQRQYTFHARFVSR